MKNKILKQALSFAGIVLLFLILSYGFVPQVLSGKIANQSDISAWKGMTHEIVEHNEAHPDDKTQWTNSMFGGMPTVAMYDDFEGDLTKPLYKLLLSGSRPASYFFVAMLGAFLLMLSLGIDGILAMGGAVAVAFCSYNMQIIQVGHNTKMQAIAFMPWVLAAVIFTYRNALKSSENRKRQLLETISGSILFAIALSFQIKANHPQISYYLAIIIVIYALSLFIWTLVKDKSKCLSFILASALLLGTGLIGIATNANKLLPTWKYTPYTMRGGSELAKESSDGLELGYATAWSYGVEETPNLMIPDFNGGASAGKLPLDSNTGQLLSQAGYKGRELSSTLNALPLYWGPQPFTAGPMYVGSISIFLFILGLFLLKGKEKWWLLVSTVLAIMLAWGNHLMWFTKLWYDYAPLYNKFRTVSMALVVLQVTVPVLGFLALDHILKTRLSFKDIKKPLGISLALTAGFCLLCCLLPDIAGSFVSAADSQYPEALADSLAMDRRALLIKDASRSLIFICLCFICIIFAIRKDNGSKELTIAKVAICILIVLDLAPVGKRYLNESHFVNKKEFKSQFNERAVDKEIKQDQDLDFRVLDLSVNTFNDAHQSYHHKCIGGYSPAKLSRYQDLIEKHISKEISSIASVANGCKTISELESKLPSTPVLNMLNTKYIILDADIAPVEMLSRYGNAWLVDSIMFTESAEAEIDALGKAELKNIAVIGKDFAGQAVDCGKRSDEDSIELISYAANELHYRYSSKNKGLAVFSEIYYPGWKATILPSSGQAQEAELFRADWTLRATYLPEGQGEIVMRFEPSSYKTGEALSRASSIILLLALLLCCGAGIYVNLNSAKYGTFAV